LTTTGAIGETLRLFGAGIVVMRGPVSSVDEAVDEVLLDVVAPVGVAAATGGGPVGGPTVKSGGDDCVAGAETVDVTVTAAPDVAALEHPAKTATRANAIGRMRRPTCARLDI
jgi:hypothetical protein